MSFFCSSKSSSQDAKVADLESGIGHSPSPSKSTSSKPSGHKFLLKRSFQRVPLLDVRLDDVLDNKHLPPLTLKEFENYLCFRERSAENLYFVVWFKSYESLYTSNSEHLNSKNLSTFQVSKSAKQTKELLDSFSLTLETFFFPEGDLELNLPQHLQPSNLLARNSPSKTTYQKGSRHVPSFSQPPSPESLRPIYNHIYRLLSDSFRSFLINHALANADRKRQWFALVIGLLIWSLGWLFVAVSVGSGLNRAIRLGGLPFWLFGGCMFAGGVKALCPVIYLFGDSRQLYPWELTRFSNPEPENYAANTFNVQLTPLNNKKSLSEKKDYFAGIDIVDSSFGPLNYFRINDISGTPSTPTPSEPSPIYQPSPNTDQRSSSRPFSYSSKIAPFVHYRPDESITPSTSSPVFAPTTRIGNPLVVSCQRKRFWACFGWGIFGSVMGLAVGMPI